MYIDTQIYVDIPNKWNEFVGELLLLGSGGGRIVVLSGE